MIRVEGFSSVHFNLEEQVCVSRNSSVLFSLPHFAFRSLVWLSLKSSPKYPPLGWTNTKPSLIWYAKEKGWDKEAGLDIDIQYFGSGMDILNALPSGSWVFAGMGGVPAMMGNLRYGTSVIAIGNDESMTNSVLVRPDSPIAKVKGYNKDFPEVLGSPDTVKGKTFLTTTVSSAHYGLSSRLKVLGLIGQGHHHQEYGPGPGSGRV